MHVFDLGASNASLAGAQASCTAAQGTTSGIAHIQFAANQTKPGEANVGKAIAQSYAAQKFFYGIEVTASKIGNINCLDYSSFGRLLPLFTSIVWIGNINWNVEPIECVGALQLANRLSERMNVVSHFTAYRLTCERLERFLALGSQNILIIRGDNYEENQTYKYSSEMVRDVRRLRGDTISIGVAGYPTMHPTASSPKHDIEMLAQKVCAGADYIITQICFSTEKIIEFVRNCRAIGIEAPIMVGIIIPESIHTVRLIAKIAQVPIDLAELATMKGWPKKEIRAFFIKRAANQIIDIMSADIGIYGFQFYTLNHFAAVREVLDILREKGIIDDGEVEQAGGCGDAQSD